MDYQMNQITAPRITGYYMFRVFEGKNQISFYYIYQVQNYDKQEWVFFYNALLDPNAKLSVIPIKCGYGGYYLVPNVILNQNERYINSRVVDINVDISDPASLYNASIQKPNGVDIVNFLENMTDTTKNFFKCVGMGKQQLNGQWFDIGSLFTADNYNQCKDLEKYKTYVEYVKDLEQQEQQRKQQEEQRRRQQEEEHKREEAARQQAQLRAKEQYQKQQPKPQVQPQQQQPKQQPQTSMVAKAEVKATANTEEKTNTNTEVKATANTKVKAIANTEVKATKFGGNDLPATNMEDEINGRSKGGSLKKSLNERIDEKPFPTVSIDDLSPSGIARRNYVHKRVEFPQTLLDEILKINNSK